MVEAIELGQLFYSEASPRKERSYSILGLNLLMFSRPYWSLFKTVSV